jgi:hypothetical protein
MLAVAFLVSVQNKIKMDKIQKLTDIIKLNIKELTEIKVGQVFNSKYYGDIVATKVTYLSEGKYSIYGFDIKEGLPRDNYYPRDLDLVGKEPMLNNVLYFFIESLYSTSKEDKHLSVLDMILSEWDYSKMYLKDQSEATINYLFDLAGCS